MICNTCNEEKGEDEFFFKNKKEGLRHKRCKTCYRKHTSRTHYARNKESYLERNKALKSVIKNYIIACKSNPCVDCGVEYHHCVMDFDHVRGEKSFNLGQYAKAGTLKKVQEEIAKCDLVCSNCHRMRTWNRRFRQKIERESK